MRRGRKSESIRSLLSETRLNACDLVQPLFVLEGVNRRETIEPLPGIERLSSDLIIKEVKELWQEGLQAVALFPVIEKSKKNRGGSEAINPDGLIAELVRRMKVEVPQMVIITDIALDPYTDHGHDGLVDDQGSILNDETIEVLNEMACLLAEAGADIVAPSDMMDGRVREIRRALDQQGWINTSILSYAAKYASSLYGPFRGALQVNLQFGDKKTYQMNPANSREALLECKLDEDEGADMLMIKPALSYLDIISKVRQETNLPIAAYHVSGEYAMVMAAHEKGWIKGQDVMHEHLLSIKRAGADLIFTYAAKNILSIL